MRAFYTRQYFCAWGPDCRRFYDIVDLVIVEDELGDRLFVGASEELGVRISSERVRHRILQHELVIRVLDCPLDFVRIVSRAIHHQEHIIREFGQLLAPDLSGGLNGSMQHSSRTRFSLRTKAKSFARVRSAGTLRRLGFGRAQPNRSLLLGKHVESTLWMVLHRPFEPTAFIRWDEKAGLQRDALRSQ